MEDSQPPGCSGDRLVGRSAYRAWRAGTVRHLIAQDARERCDVYGDFARTIAEHPLRIGRRGITRFRERVAKNLRSSSQIDPARAPLFRRALGIPAFLPLARRLWMLPLWIPFAFMPTRWSLWFVRQVLRRVGTYEGREHIFERLLSWTVPEQLHYSGGVDYAFRYLPLGAGLRDYQDVGQLEHEYLRLGVRLGMRHIVEMVDAWEVIRRCYAPDVLRVLVDEGVLRNTQELSWVPVWQETVWQSRREVDAVRLRAMVRLLLAADVPRARIPGLLNTPHRYDPARLDTAIALLQARQVSVADTFDALGETLWCVDKALWCFVLDEIGARMPGELKRFTSMLHMSHQAPVATVQWMRQHGATLDELAEAQPLLTEAARASTPPLECLDVLAGYGVAVSDLPLCSDYVLRREAAHLRQYLEILVRYGYTDTASILAFHTCYAAVWPARLDEWLSLVGPLNDRAAASQVANWVQRACARRYLPSLAYVVANMKPASLDALEQTLIAMDLCPALVRYVVEERGLTTVKAFRTWYYGEAWGAKDYVGGSDMTEVDRVLVGDAFDRKNFTVLEGNRVCLNEALERRVREILPQPISPNLQRSADDETEVQSVVRAEGDALIPIVRAILEETRGVLLPSLLETAWRPEVSMTALLDALRPLIDELLCGRGPTEASLTNVQLEAIALVYGVAPSLVRGRWHDIISQQTQWQAYGSMGPYVMQWQRSVLQVHGTLDRNGLCSLGDAARYARRFEAGDAFDAFQACKHLRARQLGEPLADAITFHRHLGVVLAAAAGDDIVREWIARRLEALAQLSHETTAADREINELHDFFHITLPDALTARLERFIARFGDEEAQHIALRLGAAAPQADDMPGSHLLRETLGVARDKALKIYGTWSAREKKKFKSRRDATNRSTMRAFISKHPAAFFGKEAAALCSRDRVAMWKEDRHAHLVVFDTLSRAFAGMAMLYREVVPAIHPSRPSLVIRGINPTSAKLTGHDAASVVEAFFATAVTIAKAHGLVAVAFPADGSQDFLSNRTDIGNVIKNRYVKHAVAVHRLEPSAEESDWHGSPRAVSYTFYGYEQGSDHVKTLYVIWHAATLSAPASQSADTVSA